jgi:hypothetical protein
VLVAYLDDLRPSIRKQAALTCSSLLLRSPAVRGSTETTVLVGNGALQRRHRRHLVQLYSGMFAAVATTPSRRRINRLGLVQVLSRLLRVGVADPDPDIRLVVLSSLDAEFDP